MSIDLLVENATLPGGRTGQDMAVEGSRITAMAPRIAAEAVETIDAEGRLVSPHFVNPHFPMDATLSLCLPGSTSPGPCSKA